MPAAHFNQRMMVSMSLAALPPLTLVFDLDGTLVDTAPDLIAATNHTLARMGYAPAADDVVRPSVSHGALAMIRAGIGEAARDWPEDKLYGPFEDFISYYQNNISVRSQPFPGVLAALDRAQAAGHRLAVCTNKREALARQLLDSLGLTDRFGAIAGRDTFAVYKPDPGHLLQTLDVVGGSASHAIMVGDSGVDVATAKAAHIGVIAVSFGYSDPPVHTFEPDALIHHYDEFDAALILGRPLPLFRLAMPSLSPAFCHTLRCTMSASSNVGMAFPMERTTQC
jgi:phosphoglycolate phosphatase